MAAIKNFSAEEEEEEDDDVSLSDLPVYVTKQEKTQLSSTKSDSAQDEDEDFDFGSSMRGGSNLILGGTTMCAADEVFFQGQLLPLRFSVSSDAGFTGLTRRCDPSSNAGFRSNSCSSSRISHNSSFSSTSSSATSTTTATAATTIANIASSKPKTSPSKPRNHFYAEPSPKPQIKIPNPRMEKIGNNRHQKSSMWDFFRLGLVRTPEMELQDLNKIIRSNSNNRSSVSRNSSVSSNNSAKLFSNFSSIASFSGSLKAESLKQSKKQRFFGNIHGCKCSFETVASDNLIVKSRSSSSGRISDVSESGGITADAAELKMGRNSMQKHSKKQSSKQKQKEAMSHHRTYEWLKELSHANSLPPPVPVHA